MTAAGTGAIPDQQFNAIAVFISERIGTAIAGWKIEPKWWIEAGEGKFHGNFAQSHHQINISQQNSTSSWNKSVEYFKIAPMQNSTEFTYESAHPAEPDHPGNSLQAHFKPEVPFHEIAEVVQLKRAQPLLQACTALFHGGSDSVLLRLLVLRELASDVHSSSFSRSDINARLAYLQADSLDTVLARLRSHHLLHWNSSSALYRITPMARNVLSALDSLLGNAPNDATETDHDRNHPADLDADTDTDNDEDGNSHANGDAADNPDDNNNDSDDADMRFLLTQVAGAQALGGVTARQLHHLLGRLIDLTEEFRDAIASGSEYRLRSAQSKWNNACDWVEKGTSIIYSITTDSTADTATHRVAQAIGRAQSALLNMQGMFSRALNQIERQRVHLGQSGLSTSDIKSWLLKQPDLAALADKAIAHPVMPLFATPAEMIDVAEAELLSEHAIDNHVLPTGTDTPVKTRDERAHHTQLDAWLLTLDQLQKADKQDAVTEVSDILLPGSFAVASYRASLLPLIGDQDQSSLQGAASRLSLLALELHLSDQLITLNDPEVAAISSAQLVARPESSLSPAAPVTIGTAS